MLGDAYATHDSTAMTLSLSTSELAKLTRAATLLVSPLEQPSVDAWRREVNRALRELLQSDSAGFLLPGAGVLLYSDEHDPAELARYPDLHPPPLADGTSIWQRLVEARVSTMPTVYGADVQRYTSSAYYNEYAAPNGAADTLCAMLPLGGADPRHVASVQLWRERHNPRRFDERDRQVLGLLVPALTAGVQAIVRWHQQRDHLANVLDALGQPAMLCDPSGVVVHQTNALGELLASDPQADAISAALRKVVASANGIAEWEKAANLAVATPILEVSTALARYRVRANVQHSPRPLVVAAVERLTRVAPSMASLRETFALTPAESRVALLLMDGRSNRDIADRLAISPFTARRHTERVLRKLGVRTRSEVAARLRD